MPAKLDAETIEAIRDLRDDGNSINAVAAILGLSRFAVLKYQPRVKGRRSTHWIAPQRVIEDPAELDASTPIPFYPADLPRLEFIPVDPHVMREMARVARRWLWLQPPTIEELTAAPSRPEQR